MDSGLDIFDMDFVGLEFLNIAPLQIQNPGRRNNSNGEPSSAGATAGSTNQLSIPTSLGSLTDELVALLECPVCFETVLPPITQCHNGHLVCASCRPKLFCCPTCRGLFSNIRNLAMEKVASFLIFPCKHKQIGCQVSLTLNEKIEHEKICEFFLYDCPFPGNSCSWQGQVEKVMEHLQHVHKNIMIKNQENIVFVVTNIHLPGTVNWVVMQSCFGHNFMLILEKHEDEYGYTKFFAIVQIIGSHKEAKRFVYQLELHGNRRRISWKAIPWSSRDGMASAIMNTECLVFGTSIVHLFADNNGNLNINVTISINSC